ncbi:MAG: phosphatase PAP2 family protein [Bryobacteraceae bacterium]
MLVTARVRRRSRRIAIWAVCVAMIGMIGLSRVYLGVHYPSDVIAGYMTACVWLVMLNAAIERFKASSAAEATQAKRRSSAGQRT